MLRAYSRLLHERPLAVNTLTGYALGGAGDVLAQQIEGSSAAAGSGGGVDWWHCFTAGCAGAGMSGILVPAWYRWLERKIPGNAASAVARKSVADIAVAGAIGNALALFARGAPAAEVWRSMPSVMLMDCTVWLPYNLLAFRQIPLHVRPTTTTLMTFGWNTYLSLVAARGRSKGGGEEPVAA